MTTTKLYSWGIFWEDGNRYSFDVPFGPEHPDNIIGDLDSPWIERVDKEIWPGFQAKLKAQELPFGFIIVNPPREVEDGI